MTRFLVDDMHCDHCAGAIRRAVQALDPALQVTVDLPAHRVEVDGEPADPAAIARAIREAGYTPQPLAD
ncbi:heavy-metal-associated domain-containing protein [Piscinibacter sakaiensis]|uniref:Copper chaperone n=1 Tax=Piscinibacter sakaiensis TaxID=1547922 RepID=A0A0K8P934_PISS1|nr:heavy-metal-associated domain-containing protein [Piscinibacter sakaiensis]GAP38695.1 copper chaperone [Piscinibacter sakaiensis]